MAQLTLTPGAIEQSGGYILYNTDGVPAFKVDSDFKVLSVIDKDEFDGLSNVGVTTTDFVDNMLRFVDDGYCFFRCKWDSKRCRKPDITCPKKHAQITDLSFCKIAILQDFPFHAA